MSTLTRSRLTRRSLALVGAMLLGVATPVAASAQAAPKPLEITTPYPRIAVQPGANVTFDLSVTAPSTQQVGLSLEGVPAGWEATLRGGGFVIDGVSASPDRTGSASLELKVPIEAKPSAYSFRVKGQAGETPLELPLTVRVDEAAASAVEITTDFPKLSGKPSDTFTYDMTIKNNTPEQQVFNFQTTGPDGWEVNASPSTEARASTLKIEAGSTGSVRVEARPPASVAAGEYPIGLVVANAKGQRGEAQLVAVVTGQASLKMAMADQRVSFNARAGRTTSRSVLISNDGSAALENVSITASPPADWTATFEPSTIAAIEAGKSATVTMKLRPAKDALSGDYVVSATSSAGTASTSVDLRVTVKQSRLWGLFGIGLVALAVGVLWLVFRRFGRR